MPSIRLMEIFYKELSKDYCSLNYLAEQSGFSKFYIWEQLRLMKALKMIDEKYSPIKAKLFLYKLRPELILRDFSYFYKKFMMLEAV